MNRIKFLRKSRNFSQVRLADILGVSRSAVSMWEIDKSQPDGDMLVRISELFGVSTDYLLGHDLSADGQKEKPAISDGLSDDERKLVDLFRLLNPEGREKALDLLDDLVQSGKYVQKSNAAVMAAKEVSL